MTAGLISLPVAMLGAWAAHRWLTPAVVWQLYRRALPHQDLAPPDIDAGAGTADIQYWAGTFDARAADLVVELVIPDADYWMIGVYDCYAGRSPGGHLCHRDVDALPGTTLQVRVGIRPGEAPWLDVSPAPRGLMMFRVLRPRIPVVAPRLRVEAAP